MEDTQSVARAEHFAVGRKGGLIVGGAFGLEREQFLGARDIPEFDRFLAAAAGDQPSSVGGERVSLIQEEKLRSFGCKN